MVRIRFIQAGKKAASSGADLQIDAAKIRIGRGDGSDLKLLHAGVAFNHAVMRQDGDALILEAVPGAVLGSADHPAHSARLARPGDATLGGVDGSGDFMLSAEQVSQFAEDEALLAKRHFVAFDSALPNVRLWGFAL